MSFCLKFAVLALAIGAAAPARADIINGSFETGNFTGYSPAGDAAIKTASFGIAPPDGTYQALVTSGTASAGSASSIEALAGLNSGTLTSLGNGHDPTTTAADGSAISQTVTVAAGDVLSFRWNFLTNESVTPFSDPYFNDYAFFSVTSGSSQTASVLADTFSSLFGASPPMSTGFFDMTGYQTEMLTFATAGTYTLSFGVVDMGAPGISSGLLIDNLQLNPPSAVPAPPSLVLLGLGLIAARARRRFVR